MRWLARVRLLCLLILTLPAASLAQGAPSFDQLLARGAAERELGNLTLSIDALRAAQGLAVGDAQRQQASGELGAALLQARHLDQADTALHTAYALAEGQDRARAALALGNLAQLRKQPDAARQAYGEAVRLAGSDAGLAISASLNLARLDAPAQRLAHLAALRTQIDGASLAPAQRATLLLNLAHQAAPLGAPALALAYGSLAQARDLAADGSRQKADALDALAQLYEDQRQDDAALALTQAALEQAGRQPPGAVGDLLAALESRTARLRQARGQVAAALAAYQRAADQLERLRPDVPIELDDGRSSFRALFEPVYLGLADALLRAADAAPAAAGDYLRRARDAAELIKQSELQDYLGDRCATDSVKGGSPTVIPAGTAVLYPLIFPDRTELLLETAGGIARYTSPASGAEVRATAAAFARTLRNGDAGYEAAARRLYDWLLRPIEGAAAAGQIDTLVVVPDGALRLVPIGALHDGSRYAIERYAISTVTGLSMTNTGTPAAAGAVALVAGAAQFGGAVDKLMLTAPGKQMARDVARNVAFGAPAMEGPRGLAMRRTLRAPALPAGSGGERLVQEMRAALALPGVGREVAAVGALLPGVALLDEHFSVAAFSQAAGSGDYRIVHVASHGIFGGSADASFVLAYDDLLTLDRLQTLLSGEQFRRHPIELLTLSACETAEGNDRAPLGISGAAIKARAKSVLGTLWPVDDEAAFQLMQRFYSGLTRDRLSKTQALRQAQLELIHTDATAHPLFWAPFSLIGNWL